jgi:hypothetical protein
MSKSGESVDSWCGACKLILAHTVEAMVDEIPARVNCNTCGAQHKYRPNKPGSATKTTRKRAAGTAPKRKPRATPYEKLLDGQDVSLAKSYSIKDSYVAGDVVNHSSFGVGVTTIVKPGNKIEIVFEAGVKTLVHCR